MRRTAAAWIVASAVGGCFGDAPPLGGEGSDGTAASGTSSASTRGPTSSASTSGSVGPDSAGGEAGSLTGESGQGGSTGGGACTDPPPGLVALWRFDGDAIDDVSGIELSPTGTPTYGEGRFDQALALDSIASWVETGSPEPILGLEGAPFSIEAWVLVTELERPTESPAMVPNLNLVGRMIPGASAPNGDGWRVFVDPGHAWAFCLGQDANGCRPEGAYVAAMATAPVQTWTHLVAIRTQSEIRLFVDGAPASVEAVGLVSGDGPLVVGASTAEPAMGEQYLYEAFFYGRVDELAIYDRPLMPVEVMDLLDAPSPKCVP